MVKVTVIKDSVIHRQQIYKINDSFMLDDKVAVRLLEDGYVSIEGGEEVAEVLAEAGIETLDVPFQKNQLEEMEYAEVVQLAKDLGVKASGKKTDIIERILESQSDDEVIEDDADCDEAPNTGMPE